MKNDYFNKILYLIVALLPLERLLTFDLFGYTVKPAYLLAIIYVIFVVYKYFRKLLSQNLVPIIIQKIKIEELWMLILILWSFLSCFWSLAPRRTVVMSALLALMVLVFILLRRKLDSEMRQKILRIITNTGIAVSLLAIIQFFLEHFFGYNAALLREQYGGQLFGFARPQATFLEPLYLANFLLFPIFIELNKELRIMKKGENGNIQYSIFNIQILKRSLALVLMLVAFIVTLSRGAYLGLTVGFVAFVTTLAFVKAINWQKLGGIIVATLISIFVSLVMIYAVAGGVGVNNFVGHAIKTSDLAPTNEIEALQNRRLSGEVAFQNFVQNPIFGSGLASFGALPQFKELRKIGEWQTVNNQYLEIATELGLVGLLLFLAVVYSGIRYQVSGIRKGKYDNIVFLGWIVSVIVQYFTFSSIYLLYLWVFLAIIWPINEEKQA